MLSHIIALPCAGTLHTSTRTSKLKLEEPAFNSHYITGAILGYANLSVLTITLYCRALIYPMAPFSNTCFIFQTFYFVVEYS